jgi:hypothetical protein
MGWFFRKSAKFGPFRLNFSKSGIGVSAGMKGARVSTGPRGTYLNFGRRGLYYRQKVGGGMPQRSYASPRQHSAETIPRPSLPTEITSRLPAYPQFPKHGLPRIVKTLGLLLTTTAVIAAVGSLWFMVFFSSVAPKRPVATTSKPTPSGSPQSYREALTFTKGGRNLVYVVVEKNLPEVELTHVAMLLHANRPRTSFRLFDDEVQLQEFKNWEVHSSDKTHPYPKQWADTHYIADIHQASNSHTKKLEWQLGDRRGRRIASLE